MFERDLITGAEDLRNLGPEVAKFVPLSITSIHADGVTFGRLLGSSPSHVCGKCGIEFRESCRDAALTE